MLIGLFILLINRSRVRLFCSLIGLFHRHTGLFCSLIGLLNRHPSLSSDTLAAQGEIASTPLSHLLAVSHAGGQCTTLDPRKSPTQVPQKLTTNVSRISPIGKHILNSLSIDILKSLVDKVNLTS